MGKYGHVRGGNRHKGVLAGHEDFYNENLYLLSGRWFRWGERG